MKDHIRVHILPTYRVDEESNFNIYDVNDQATGDLVGYDKLLTQLEKKYVIDQILISGGDISKLSDLYFDLLYKVVKLYSDNVAIYTRFITFNEALINGADIINVEYNFAADSKYKKQIFSNIKAAIQVGKIINLKTLDAACTLEPIKTINILNKLNIKSWEIVPYINDFNICHFEDTVLNFLNYSYQMNFAFYNKLQIEGIISAKNYSTKLIYLTPHTKVALADYTNGKFSLKEYEDLTQLHTNLNEINKQQEIFCKDCNVKLKCLANYYQNFNTITTDCYGFSSLISKCNTKNDNKENK